MRTIRTDNHQKLLPGIAGCFVLLIAVLCLNVFSCQAQEETEACTAVLTFSSFGGGGPEYSIEIDDPGIVSCSCRTEYEDQDQEAIPGAGFEVIYTFTGLKPGTTQMTVSMSSPLMERQDAHYSVVVDDDLNVTLSQERQISRFELYRNGEIAYDSYQIITFMDNWCVSVNGDEYQRIDDKYAEELFQVIEKYDLYQWDGFDEVRSGVLDGEGFRLEISFTDGTSIRANGDNAFPENYFQAVSEMQDILDSIETEPQGGLRGMQDFFCGLFSGNREGAAGKDNSDR